MAKNFTLIEYHDHPDGTDRGGTLQEERTFYIKDGKVTHEWSHDYPGDVEDFGIDEGCLEKLETHEDAVAFLRSIVDNLQHQLDEAVENLNAVQDAGSYEDITHRYA